MMQATFGDDVAPGARGTVFVVELRPLPDALKAHIEQALRDELQVEVKHLESMPLSKSAYYKPRNRWRADTILGVLKEIHGHKPPTTRALALRTPNIWVTKEPFADWGIVGLANSPGQAAVVSMFRKVDDPSLGCELAVVQVYRASAVF